ncbi:MAG: TetR/AcrR family transcriptional regulator [Coriobacteriales bacterium]
MITSSFFSHSALSRINIFAALAKLLKSEELDDITVKQICAEAGVGRSSFYACFGDKYSVIQWYTDLIHHAGAAQIGRSLSWREGHIITTKGYLAHLDVLNAAARSKDYNALSPYSIRRWKDSIETTITQYKGLAMTPELEMQALALSTAATAVASHCFERGLGLGLEQIVDILISITPPALYKLLEEPVNPMKDGQPASEELALIELMVF